MRRLLCVVLVVCLGGCSSRAWERGWSTSWSLVETPVLLACTPYDAAWDLAIFGCDEFHDGLTASYWERWWDSMLGRDPAWGAPLALVVLPALTAVQPLTVLLHLLSKLPTG